MVVKTSSLVSDFNVRNFTPGSNNLVVIFVVINWNRIMNDVADLVDLNVDFFQDFSFFFFCLFLSLLIFRLELKLLFAFIFLVGFLFTFDLFLSFVPFFLEAVKIESHYIRIK